MSFDELLRIAYDATNVYKQTGADSPEEAIMKLSIFGDVEQAQKFEKEVELVIQSYKDNQILPVKLTQLAQKEIARREKQDTGCKKEII